MLTLDPFGSLDILSEVGFGTLTNYAISITVLNVLMHALSIHFLVVNIGDI